MKIILTAIIILISGLTFSQDSKIENNPYDKADEVTKESKAFQREKWFYEQRMYPNNYIPKDAYKNANDQKEKLKRDNGFAMMGPFDSWTSIGPTTGFYFSYSNISSRITTVKYDPNNGNIIYIGAANGGIWKSTDGGTSWTAKSDNEASLSSGSIAIDPSNSNIIYYGTGEATYSSVSYFGKGILKSTDAGNTWTNYTSGLPSTSYTSRIVIRPNHSGQLLAAMGIDGLYRSSNGGIDWAQLVPGRCDDVVFSPTGDTAYIVGSGTGYRISINGGVSFTANGSLQIGNGNRVHISLCKTSPSILYCAVFSGQVMVFKSTDAGLSFNQIASGQDFNSHQAWYDFYMHVNPYDPNCAFVGTLHIFRTTDGGATNFTNITSGYGGYNVHSDQQNMDFHPTDPNQMLCVNDGGIWKSTDKGTSWTNLNTNQTLTQFYRIASDPSNANHIMGGTQDNGTQRTLGSLNWSASFGGDGGEVCFHSVNNSYILGESQNNNLMRSTNGGASWIYANSGLYGTAAWVGPILSHPDSAAIFYTARTRLFKSSDWGESWFPISPEIHVEHNYAYAINEMAISRSSSNIMYATSGGRIYKSTDRGYNYTNVTTGLPGRTITSVNIHPDSSEVAVITLSGFGSGHIYKTTNGGTSWFNNSGNLPDAPANDAFIFYPGVPTGSYYIATDVGVFVTSDYGQNWTELANGLPNTVAMSMDYHESTNKLRIATHGRGVFEIQLRVPALPIQVRNGNFTNYTIGNNYYIYPSGTSVVDDWNASGGYPYLGRQDGCSDSGWVGLKSAEISQVLSNRIIGGRTYQIKMCARLQDVQPWPWTGFGTINVTFFNSATNVSNSVEAGSTQQPTTPPMIVPPGITSTQWTTYSYLWTAPNDFDIIKLSSGYYMHIDNISVTEVQPSFITLIPEGFYNTSNNRLNMIDTVTAYLRNSAAPFEIVDSSKAVVDSLSFTGKFVFTNFTDGMYYIQIKHRNSIETWSKNGVPMTAGLTNIYDFTTSQSQAFGDNLSQVGSKYCMYGGDIDQNGTVDLSDILLVYNDATNFQTGYVKTDVTGNQIVDLDDLILTYNNSSKMVSVIRP